MPLASGSSREAFSKNVATEVAAGKPQKQAVAIAYAQERKSDVEVLRECADALDTLHGRMDAMERSDAVDEEQVRAKLTKLRIEYQNLNEQRKELEARARQAKKDGRTDLERILWDAALKASTAEHAAFDAYEMFKRQMRAAGIKP